MSARRPDGCLRVATLNLWGWFDDWSRRLEALRCAWGAVDADVLLIQEGCIQHGADQVRQTAEALGYPHTARGVAAPVPPGSEDVETVALLSRPALEDVRVTVMPPSDPPRSLVAARVEWDGTAVTVATSHTVFRPLDTCRAQIDAVCALDGAPLVVGGDLNATPDVVAPLAAAHGLSDVLDGNAAATWPVCPDQFRRGWAGRTGALPHFDLAPRRLDYVLTRGLEVVRSGVFPVRADGDSLYASDHAAVWADVRVPTGSSRPAQAERAAR